MKKKIAVMLLVTVMTASVFTGCGNSVEGDGKVQAAMADTGNSQEDSEGKAEGTEAGEPAPEATAESTAEATPEPIAEPTAEPTEEPASTTEPEKGTEPGTAADSSQGAANNSSNSQTSQQGTSNQSAQSGQQGQGTGNNGTAASANDTAASSVPDWFDPVFYAETYPDIAVVMGTDANALYQHYLDYGKAEGRKPSAETTPQTSNYLSQAFVNYLNEQRSAQGLSQVAWNSGYESTALARSQQLASNFSHDGSTVAEIILATPSNDPASWYESFAESYGHNLVIADTHLNSGAAAVYQVGDYYYVVFSYDTTASTWEEVEEMINNGEMTPGPNTYTDENGVEHPTSYQNGTEEQGNKTYANKEEAENSGDFSEEDIEWLKSIGAW